MPRPTKRKQHLNHLVAQKKQDVEDAVVESSSSESEIEEQSYLDNDLDNPDFENQLLQIEFSRQFQQVKKAKRPLVYVGNALRTKQANNAKRRKAALGTPAITSFFKPLHEME